MFEINVQNKLGLLGTLVALSTASPAMAAILIPSTMPMPVSPTITTTTASSDTTLPITSSTKPIVSKATWRPNLYVGMDAESRHMNFHKDFGGNELSHNTPQGNLYAGIHLNECVAVELGYEASKRKNTMSTALEGAVSFGDTIPPATTDRYSSTAQTKAFHINLVGTLPLCEFYRLQLIGAVGFANLKTKISRTIVTVDDIVPPPDNAFDTFVNRKRVLRLSAGIQHMIDCNWGVRAMLRWENSNKLKLISQQSPEIFSIKAKNSLIYGLGVFFNF